MILNLFIIFIHHVDVVHPNGQLALYRIYFVAPGVVCPGALVTERQDDQDVHIIINVQPIELIRTLNVSICIIIYIIWKNILRLFSPQVVYGDNPSDAPKENRVREINSQNDVESDDLNKDFGGK
jgi:hypothetical protein